MVPPEVKVKPGESIGNPSRTIYAFSCYDYGLEEIKNEKNKFKFVSNPKGTEYFDLGDNTSAIVNYIPEYLLSKEDFCSRWNGLKTHYNLDEACYESITKPPVFETHIDFTNLNVSGLRSLFGPGHAYLSIRYTYANMANGRPISFTRKRISLGFIGGYEGNYMDTSYSRKYQVEISTETPITIGRKQ